QVITETTTTTTRGTTGPRGTSETIEQAAPPVRKRVKKIKVDSSKFMTPYLKHSHKMQDLFSQVNSYTCVFLFVSLRAPQSNIHITANPNITVMSSSVKYRMAGDIAKTICHVDEKAKDIEHAKKVSQQVSKVLYKQNWEENKDKYLLPPDAPELVQAIKNTAMFSKKLYTEDWEQDKPLFYPYNDSPELRRVAQAQKVLSDIVYKKGHDERKSKYTCLSDPPDVELAKKVTKQRSDFKYHEDYENKIKGKWSQTPCYEVAVARMNADNFSMRKYQEDYELVKDQIYFMQTETPEYQANKRVGNAASKVKYKEDYEKGKAIADYNVLPATENPLLKQLKVSGKQLSDKLYKEAYEKSKTTSINYCDTPKFQIDNVLKNFSDVKYKDAYQKNILGHYVGSYENPYHTHYMNVAAMKSDKNYKADYEEDKTKCYFPQTITQEYEAIKKLDQCKDNTYKKHPDQIKFTQVTDSPVQVQAQINTKQLSEVNITLHHVPAVWPSHRINQGGLTELLVGHVKKTLVLMFYREALNYKAKHESEKFKCHMPPDAPLFLQSRVNAYNLSDNWYKYDWERSKAKKFEIKVDAIPLLAAKANSKIASGVAYKKDYELSKGKMIGALSIHDDPKMLHSAKVAKQQSDHEYKKGYELSKSRYTAPLDMIPITQAKKSQAIASGTDYKHLLHNYSYPPDSINVELAKKAYSMQSDNEYKSDYNSWMKGCGWMPFGSMEAEKAKKATDILSEKKYRQHPDTIKYTQIEDEPVIVQAKINQAQRSDIQYKAKGEAIIHNYHLPPDMPQFIQAKVNAYNISDNYYKMDMEDLKSKGYDLRNDAISIRVAKAARQAASDVHYKKDYELAKGKLVGFQSLQDDPKLVHYMNIAKMQSEREYKKDYEKTKTKYNIPLDMVNVVAAKQAQDIASNVNYKQLIHDYTYLPGAMNLELSKNMMQIQSNHAYKEDYDSWMKGIGWIPIGSLDVETARKAGEALNENKYRQHPDTIKFTSVVDSPVMVQAKQNTLHLNDRLYKSSGEEIKHKYTMTPDVPQFIQARYNAANISDAYYKQDYHDLIAKGNNVLGDAIPFALAKASRNIASDYKYKEAYEKAKGKHVGFRSVRDDPKLVHYMNVAKLQSEREYKKDYEKTKTNYHTPADMISIQAARQSQDIASNTHYKHPIHHYTYLPDAMNVELTKNMMQIQSNNLYKQDYNSWFKGIGWSPLGSLDVEKVKKAGDALNEKKYRQNPDTFKFTSLVDSMPMILAQHNTKQLSEINYKQEGEKRKHKYTLDPDIPQFIQAKVNALNMSDAYYKADWKKTIAKGYDLKPDAISVIAAKASQKIASDYKYKESYEKEKGKHVGFRSLQDDPKLVHYMNVAKMQSEREYKKGYESSKTKYHTPLDMFSVTAAKKAQEAVTNTNYKQLLHNYTLLPDAMNVQLPRHMMQIQSDSLYKTDFNNWLRGVGWMPIQSLDVEKVKKATEILSEQKYRQHPDKLKYSITTDAMEQVLAKHNAQTMNKRLYTDKWNKEKTSIHVMPDTPEILQSRVNQITMSDKLYRAGWEEEKKKGYDMQSDAIPIRAAKASRDIASDYKYKLAYEQARGKHIGFRSLEDDPKLVHFMKVAKMQSDREYKKDYEKSKTRFHTPADMFSVVAAKKAQEVATNTNYKHLIHHYNVMPDSMNLELAKNMMQIRSDNQYKADYDEFMKGVGWMPVGSLEAEKNKKAMEIISEKKYRQHPDKLKYSSLMDSMNMVLATNNAKIMDKHLYTQAWEADKTKVHIMPDIPEIALAKANAYNMSDKIYKHSLEESRRKGYDLRADAISIKAAKASRDIASDYKYKEGYRKQLGHHVGARNIQDDPKMVWSMHVAKIQSDREYKKDFEKWKTKYNSPVDMLGVVLAKKCQELVSDIDYRHPLHNWTCLPDQSNVVHARKTYDLQSDLLYKSDLQWMRGIGWSPSGSLDDEKNKRATLILSDHTYRQHPDTIKFNSLLDSLPMVLAKHNSEIMNQRSYTEAWNKDKTSIHMMPDTPDILLAQQNKLNYSEKLYRLAMEEDKKKGNDLRVDAIPIRSAKASRDIASEYKYKEGYRKQLGHHVGARNIQDDPKMVWSMHVAKIQSDREYKKDFEKWKTKYNTPVDMLGIVLAKKCQELVSEVDYRRPLHQWTCLPDQNDVVHARKTYDLQSDLLYKSDLQWMRGVGWSPIGSLDDEKNKRATLILSDHTYRQHPDTIKFNSLLDSLPMVLAKHNSEIMNQRSYTEAWNKDKTSIHVMPDTPDIVLAQQNKLNYSEKLYRLAMEEDKKKGYDLRVDAIPIRRAKASRDIASEYKYKEGYRKQLGHHVGARNIQDDPKMVWSMHVAKIQSDREYKKDFEKWKTKYNTPVDMLGIVLAKKCQELVSEVDYRRPLHHWTCLPDKNDIVHARKSYDLQSDLLYKSDLQWMKGIGWSPIGSLDDEKNKRAAIILSDHTYRQHPDTIKFNSLLDSLPMVLAKHNSEIMNQRSYTEAWNKDKTSIHVMPDTPDIVLAQQNKLNYSEKLYRLAMEEDKKKGYDLRVDAIPIRRAKASRDIASEYKYKEGYRKQLGHHVGARNIQDDPKMVWSMHVAKIQSDREYKKDFEKWKTKYNTPVDMLGIVLAKKCQELVSEVDYRHPLHQWTCLPDQNDVVHARKTYDLHSDVVYKSDLQWMKGIGWSPVGSLEDEKNKRAATILSDHTYRQHPDTIKFNSLLDSLPMVLAKHNSEIMNQRSYTEAWNKDKTSVHVMPDTPDIVLAQQNKLNYSEKLYRLAMEEDKKKGYDLRIDAIPIRSAKASRDIASEYKYKEGYRKQLGHHVGARNIQDDPKMMWSMHVAKIQSDREYKKYFEKSKTRYTSPVDMLGIVLAKKCQELVSDIDYKHPLHQWTCLPDQNDVIHARKAYELQSDNCYKSDLQWLRGIGWVPIGSLDVEKAKKAGEILSDNIYRQPPDKLKFTSVTDSLEMVLAKHNAETMNKRLYTEAWDKDKTEIHMMPDTPEITLARQNKLNYSQSLYKLAMEEAKKRGHDLRIDAIPIKSAKASRDIASDYKYKEGYRKQLGHHIGARNIQDDPKMVWSMHVAKIQSDREYKKYFEKSKTRYTSPVDMLGIVLAKKCQELVSDVDYRHPLHQWTCLPDQNDVIHARKAYDLQSDNYYKSDLQWLRGIGWVPIGSLDVEKAKKAGEILSDKIYRQPPDTFKFTSVTDSLEMVLAKNNAETMNKRLYTEAWDKDKTTIHVMPDTPEIMLAKLNQINCSEKLYKLALEELKKRGCDLRVDAIPIQAAKASRNIASEYKYKEGYRKQLGHHVGARNIQDDPKMMWSMHVAKIQSDREYKKDFENSKTRYTSPVDMLGIVQAKTCQTLVSDVDYRHYLHQWTCLPDQNDVIQAKKAYELQSDAVYKSDLEWLKGTGWVPIGSMDVEKVKRAGEILSEKQYRQPPDQIKFTSVIDSLELVLAKQNAETMNKRLYTEAWNADKTTIHVMPDTPEIMLAKANSANVSQKLYTQAWEDAKMKDYDLRADAISIKHAKASRDIASEYKYKETHEKQKGHYIGCKTAKEDPKMAWAAHVMKMQNDREYRKAYHSSKAKINIPVDMVSVYAAKEGQLIASDVDYRQYLHQWTCLPDQNDVIQARKAYDLQSDALYKSDLEWLRGIGWMPSGSVDVKRVKHAQDILSEKMYRTPVESLKYTNIVDTPDVLLAKTNAVQISLSKYREAWDKAKTTIHVMPDTPEINLAKANAIHVSNKLYKGAWDEVKMSCDFRADAIPIKSAKASREIASDYKYKLDHEKQRGHYIGTPSAREDNKIRWALHAAKLHSDLEYRKHFQKWKTKCSIPVDMLPIVAAKKCQILVSDIDYRNYLHRWTCLPDQNDVIQAKKAYQLQSDAVYKSDLEWLRGIGWMPNDSVGINHVKHVQDLLNERKYRTKAETLKFTPVADRVDYVTAKQSGEMRSDIKYHQDWNAIKSNYTLTDTPQQEMAREAARILNQNLYKESWEKVKSTGYILPPDAVQLRHAKHSGDVQSELQYKAEYVNHRGHYVGVPSMRDDPKLVWFEHAGKIQNDRLYKSAYHKSKSNINIPADIISVLAAKECQTLVSDIDYRQYLHEWTCHPDQNDCIQARKAYDLQSDNIYKSDLEWIRGCGWIPLDSVEHRKVKKAQELIDKVKALDNYSHFTSVVDTPDIVLAKINSVNQSDLKYKETFNLDRGHFIGSDDTPALNHTREMSKIYSDKRYKHSWETGKAIGYTLPPEYIPIVGAKHADYINSELKYKEFYEKQKGHYLAGKHISEFPSVVHSLAFQKLRSALAYRKNYEDTKANVHIPSDMLNHLLAKKCQYILSDLEYRTYLHQWNCSPEENDVVLAKKAQEILSDVVYKDDLNWLKGLGCYVWDTPQILHAKKSYDLQSQLKYTAAGKENLQNYSAVTDTPLYVTAVQSGIHASEVKYKENYHQIKDKYTTVVETVDHERTQNLKHLFSNNLYKEAWDKVKATGYKISSDSVSLSRAKELKHNASIVKYREEYDKFKALYTLPRSVEDDPNTARCLRVGKFNIDRLYKEVYEKNKAKIHILPDMVDIVAAKATQKKVSEIDYRLHLHEWTCLPDLQINAHVRKVTDQLSEIVYKDDLNWLKGIGCFVWDTPEILHAKHAYDLRSDIKYKSKAEKMKNDYTMITDTPYYVQNVISGKNLSDAVYRHAYVHNIRGKMTPTDKTVDLVRAKHAHKIQSENLYRGAGLHALPTGYKLPPDTPGFKLAKHVQYIGSDLKYKEAYEHIKAKGYTLGPKAVGFEHIKKVNKVLNERLYREIYHKNKDKIHTTPDTPEIRQVKATQEAISDLIYKADFFKMQGHLISLPYTPQVIHCRYVGDITSDNKYKEDLQWLRGLGCFLYDTPDMVRARHLRELWSNYVYTNTAKKMRDKYSVVLDTPEYRKVQELKAHLSEVVYRAAGKKQKTKFTSILDTPDFLRAKKGQKIQSQYLYVELATKERPHHHVGDQTPALTLAKHVKDMVSEKKYKAQYEKMKHKYTTVSDTPILIRAKKAYWNASDLRYKETFEQAKGKYHTVKDALDIVYHRKVTDDISSVKYKENYLSQLGIWRSIPDRPEHYHHRAVTDAISDVKYKEDLSWLRGFGCYAWDTPDLALAEKNKVLYSGCKYKESFEKMKSQFEYVADCPINKHFKHATQLMNEFKYKRQYELQKDKFTSIVDTPEHLRTAKVNKQISEIIYKMEFEKAKSKGYTTIHDTPLLLLMRKVKDRISALKYKEVYEKNKSHCNVVPDSVHIKAAKAAYKVNSNLDYKKKYEATKAHWQWTVDRPDFLQAAKASLQQSDYDYKLDREFLRGCKLSVTDDKNTVLALKNAILASDLKYKEKHNKARGTCLAVPDTPQILLSKCVSSLVSENKYKEQSKRQLPHGSYTTLPETQDTVRVKEVTRNVSETNYKKKFVKEKGKSNYSIMLEPPEVKHAMEVAKKQSIVEYKKDAKSQLHYTSIADRPDIKKATQAARLISDIQYKAKARGETCLGVSMLGRPDMELAKEVSILTSQLKYKAKFDKEKGKRPKYDLKEAKIYKTLKDAHNIASEVKYKADLKKLHKPVTDMSESLIMNHVLSTSQLSSAYQYKKQYEKSKGHYHVVPDNLEQLHLKEATELQSQVKYKEKYEKEKGKAMLDFETPTYITAMESQHMQSEKEYKKDYEESIKGRNLAGLEITPSFLHFKYATKIASEKEYRRDLEEGVKGKGMTLLEETPDMLRAKNATHILNEKEYKKSLELEIKGRGLTDLALETPDYMRAKNATDIASEIKYKHLAEMDKANYTSVIDTPEIIHAQQVKNLSSQKKYKEDAGRTMSHYLAVVDTPEMLRVRENQKNFSTLQYQWDAKNIKGKVMGVQDTPEILRVKENQKNFSSILYKEDIGTGTAIEKTPEMQRIKRTQDAISTVLYKEGLGTGTPTPVTPEMERVKRNQENFSSVLYKENLGTGTPTPVTPEIERVKRNQEHFSSVFLIKHALGFQLVNKWSFIYCCFLWLLSYVSQVLYKEHVGKATPTPVTPEMERVKRNQEHISSVLYKEHVGKATPTPVTPEMERVKRNQEHISSVLYKENLGRATPTPVTPEMERVKRNQENISSVLYSDSFRKQVQGKAAYVLDTPEMRRVRETQRHISTVKYHEDFEKHKGSFTPVVTDPITERVKKNMQDFSDIHYRGIQRKVVEMERKRVDQDQETITGLRVWRTNPGSVFDYDPAEDNIQSRSLHMISVQAQRRSREQSRSASALSLSAGDEKSEHSEGADHHLSYYSNGVAYKQAKTIELPQQRSSSVATQLTTVSSVPSHPSTTGKTYRAMYDYMAADADEVSFKDGDAIVNVQAIDEGWMYGTVQRTGKTGMLPANYVEAV
uniref:Nebulin n=3 Tax=Chelydra serpentina TaxID=8475 RepID=A0A8C3S0Y8_CHESE